MAVVSSRQRGLSRVLSILSYLEQRLVLSRSQVQLAVFGSSNYATWKARTVLKKMFDEGKVKRGRAMVTGDYVYFVGRKPEYIDHTIQVNWVWVSLLGTGQLDEFKQEVDCGGILVADAYFILDRKPYFLEVQRAVNHSKFDKVKLYTDYFTSCAWNVDNWPMPGRFARILIVTETEKDAVRIRHTIHNENEKGLKFIVATLEQVREDVMGCLSGKPAGHK